MQIFRTLIWVLILVILLAFSAFNWKPVEVQIWDNLVLETKVPALVIVSFLLGLIPMWLIYRGTKWRLSRRIVTLENALKTNTVTTLKDDPDITVQTPEEIMAPTRPSDPDPNDDTGLR
ncbi:MAG: DUF1049 domain-containing protein [Parerythrobacter sp.]